MSKVNLKDITIMELLLGIIRRYSSAVAMQIKEGGHFRSLTYTRIGMRVSNTSYALKKLGLMKGERAAIFSESRPEWAIAFFGIVPVRG